MGYNQQQYNQQLLPANPTYVGTQVLSFVPKQLIVNWSMVGALSKLGPKILVNPNTGEHDNYLSGKLNIVGPTEVRNYVPYPLGTQASGSVLGYDYRFAVAHPRNSNLIVFGNKTSSTDSFMKVLSTENIVSLGKELDNYNLGPGLITTIGQDIGPLFDDYTPSLNGEFVLVGRPDLINIVSYVEDFKSVTYNGNQYDIPLYGFDPISIAVRTPTKFRQNNIDIKDLLADKEDADQNNPGS